MDIEKKLLIQLKREYPHMSLQQKLDWIFSIKSIKSAKATKQKGKKRKKKEKKGKKRKKLMEQKEYKELNKRIDEARARGSNTRGNKGSNFYYQRWKERNPEKLNNYQREYARRKINYYDHIPERIKVIDRKIKELAEKKTKIQKELRLWKKQMKSAAANS